jgi:CheY-like chemotaxis protein
VSETAPAKILIVEDSPTTRAVIKVYLLGHHLEFIEAQNGNEGLAIARAEKPSVAIVDLKMPGLDGFSFCRAVRADVRIHSMPLVLLTGTKGEEVRREAIQAGASYFMTKPIDGPALAETILSCLERKR